MIEQLRDQHVAQEFSCGIEALDHYFKHRALRDVHRNIAAVFVLVDDDASAVMGFYTLSSLQIDCGEVPADVAKKLKLPKYPAYPATLVGRLAVDLKFRGSGYGSVLLIDALRRAYATRKTVASLAVVVDAKNEAAARFYERYRFISFPARPRRLFLPMRTIGELLRKSGIEPR